ncbi:MAG: DUF1573 domain-containing protein [Parcubacteria group bacterium]|nr:DUF1573 domain-containing protein [Parcubacteria group bacterium]
MNKTIVITLISLLVGGGLIFWSYNNSKAPNENPNFDSSTDNGNMVLTAAETNYDFGEVSMARGLVEHKFVLKNNSAEVVKIGRVETSCMCTTAYLLTKDGKEFGPFGMAGHSGMMNNANLKVNPSEELIVRAVFDPAAHGPAGVGPIERQVALTVGGAPLFLDFKALVKP